ncbi:CBO0543 family protein [Bacillus sp. es.034]|uniref:CBO0543 family protein n=1 Tax=Bacillus sp. es.034 TaxID=1761763 RepID=UPI000BF35579|nr:CBO0543 family protein [Bacillus sp. es.034]
MKNQMDMLNDITEKQRGLTQDWVEYWKLFSSFDTWQFWFQAVLFVVPLIIIFFKIDKNNAFQIGFYGFNIHVWLGYIDRFGVNAGYWDYPYQFMVWIPNNLTLDASLIPVIFMMVYQWIVKQKKNYYLYTGLLAVFLSFIFKPLLDLHNFMRFNIRMPYLYLFLGYICILVLSKIITDIFSRLRTQAE